MTPEPEKPVAPASRLRSLGHVLLGFWVAGATLFFLLRFSVEFYLANRGAIDAWLKR